MFIYRMQKKTRKTRGEAYQSYITIGLFNSTLSLLTKQTRLIYIQCAYLYLKEPCKCCIGALSYSSSCHLDPLSQHTPLLVNIVTILLLLSCDSHSDTRFWVDSWIQQRYYRPPWVRGEKQRGAEMPRPQAAAAAAVAVNLLLFHCFQGNGGEVLLSSKAKRWYTIWGEGVKKKEQVGGWREKGKLCQHEILYSNISWPLQYGSCALWHLHLKYWVTRVVYMFVCEKPV